MGLGLKDSPVLCPLCDNQATYVTWLSAECSSQERREKWISHPPDFTPYIGLLPELYLKGSYYNKDEKLMYWRFISCDNHVTENMKKSFYTDNIPEGIFGYKK